MMSNFKGHNSSVLHYGHAGAPNNKKVNEEELW